jgi:non-specific serine/threonine protein kinase
MIEFRLLGQFSVRQDGAPIEIPSRPAQALLAYLLLTPNSPHRREKLAGLIWPDSTDANSRSYLRKALWQLRKSLPVEPGSSEEYFLVDDISIAFNASSDYWLDADVVEERPPGDSTIDELVEAVSAYQGELLPGFYEEWVALERDRIESAFDQKMNLLIDQLIEQSRWVEVVEQAEQWIALGKAPEPAYRALMTAHASLGDRAKVAAVYARCTEALLDELGVDPSKQTETLHSRLMSGEFEPAAGQVEKPEPGSIPSDDVQSVDERINSRKSRVKNQKPSQATHNLPSELSSFIGRRREISEVREQIGSVRLVTLTGPGGCGKTRLALHVAGELLGEYPDGVYLVELESLSEAALVPQEAALAMGLSEAQDRNPTQVLIEYLRNRWILLVFDNCEHVIQSCAVLAEALLKGCPQIKILATSREALGVIGEVAWTVPSLTMPPVSEPVPFESLADYDAIRLLIERSRAVRSDPDFELTEENAPAVIRICQRLDGIPLALELAAARLKALSFEQVASRLDDRFNLLTTGSRTALPRHQTLRATVDWSYELLPENEKTMLRQLSVFVGGWSLDAAESICRPLLGSFLPESDKVVIEGSDALDLLTNLVEKSLVVVERRDGNARYRMLETIRDYAREKRLETVENTAIRNRHLEIYLQMAERIEPNLQADDQAIWYDQLEMELDNIRAAIEWSMVSKEDGESRRPAARVEAGLRLAGSLGWFFQNRSHTETLDRLTRLLAQPMAAEQTKWRAKALNAAAMLYWSSSNYREGERVLEEALNIGRKIEDPWNTAWALNYMGAIDNMQGSYDEAEAHLREGLALSREMGGAGSFCAAWALVLLGDVSLYREEIKPAELLYEESVALLRELKNRNLLAYSARRLGYLALMSGEAERAIDLFRESLLLNREVMHRQGTAGCLAALAAVATMRGDLVRAAELYGAAEALLVEIASPFHQADRAENDRNMEIVRSALDDAEVAAAWEEGQGMSLEEAVEFALAPGDTE